MNPIKMGNHNGSRTYLKNDKIEVRDKVERKKNGDGYRVYVKANGIKNAKSFDIINYGTYKKLEYHMKVYIINRIRKLFEELNID